MDKSKEVVGLEYWLQWQVPICALIFIVPTVISVRFISRNHKDPLNFTHLWAPCWRCIHPLWLLLYRAFAFTSISFVLYLTVQSFGFFVFYFYTQWTFALVMVYFALGTIVSARGCWMYYVKNPLAQNWERDKFIIKDSEEVKSESKIIYNVKEAEGSSNLQVHHSLLQNEQRAGFWGNLMQNVYQICAGAVVLTDIVFWCILLPFMTGENFRLTLLIGCMHSLNAVFLLIDSILNSLPFPWYRLAYFVQWSSVYVVFHWILHACGFTWWPYPFLELSTPWAPLWYFSLALVHLPCYGLYAILIKAKGSIFPRMFPHAFVRVLVSEATQNSVSVEKKKHT